MSVRPLAATSVLIASGFAIVGLAAPASAVVCDAYSGTCPVQAPEGGSTGITGTGGGAGTSGTGGGTGITGTGGGAGTSGTGGGGGVSANTSSRPSALPFTGGELVLLSTVGIGALVGGTVLVVAGRRKAALPAV